MPPRGTLPPELTDGNWELSLLVGPRCCPEQATSSDTIHLSTHTRPRGMPKSRLYDVFKRVYPKGARTLFGATVYIVRINNQGERRMARPCDKCMSRMKTEGVKDVVYSTDEGWKRERL